MTKIFAHRGSKIDCPENTLSAFKKAIDVQADGIELDIHLTKDGEIVVIHDETIDRTTNGSGQVEDYTLAELQNFDAGSWFHESFKQEKIPTLKEVFELLIKENYTGQLNIELKTDQKEYAGLVAKALALQLAYNLPCEVVYSSFNPASLIEMHQLDQEQQLAFLLEKEEMFDFNFGDVEILTYHPGYELLHQAERFNPTGLPLRVWTVNEQQHLQDCFNRQVEAIFTDDPKTALALRDKEENYG